MKKGESAVLCLKGLVEQSVELEGTGEFSFLSVPYNGKKAGEYKLELVSGSTVAISLDGFFIGDVDGINKVNVVRTPIPFTPVMEVGETKQDFILKYKDCDNYYGVAWNYQHSEVREVLNGELESFFRRRVHEHVSSRLIGDRNWHYANAFLRPIVLEPDSEQTIYMLVCSGNKEQVKQELQDFHSTPDKLVARISSAEKAKPEDQVLPGGEKYLLGNRLLQASLLSNIVYPVYTQKEYIRHFTPGKNWNSLYTWDSGFIALGLIDVDPVKAFECIKAYTTPVGSESAFIHHGTPLPIQMYAYADLWNNSLSQEALRFLYPRLKQYFDFMVGADSYSPTRMAGSGLLRTWDYFYNSGGWDDYPPQHALRGNKSQYQSVTPVVTSAYYLRAAKILRLAAKELGLTQPAVSQHIHYLEKVYGVELFVQNGKKIALTAAGEILRNSVLTMKHDEIHMKKRMQQAAGGEREYFFGATLSVAEFMIAEDLEQFIRNHPNCHIQMQVANTKVLLEKIDSGELDFAIVEGEFPREE